MTRVAVPAPDGSSGEWRLDTIEIPEDDAAREGIAPGPMRRLLRGPVCVMTNSEREWADLSPLFARASGSVLVNGLGLGLAVVGLLANAAVSSLCVVEKSVNVIALVAPQFADARFRIVNADALTAEPGEFDVVWHDIWDTSGPEHDAEMRALWQRYAGRCRWQGVWSRPHWTG